MGATTATCIHRTDEDGCCIVREQDGGMEDLPQWCYLPKELQGSPVMQKITENTFRADNTILRASTKGVGYRKSKDPLDIACTEHRLNWGSFIKGTDEGDGWIKVRIDTAQAKDKSIKKMDKDINKVLRHRVSLGSASTQSSLDGNESSAVSSPVRGHDNSPVFSMGGRYMKGLCTTPEAARERHVKFADLQCDSESESTCGSNSLPVFSLIESESSVESEANRQPPGQTLPPAVYTAIRNPLAIENVYTFSRKDNVKGEMIGFSRKATVMATGAERSIKSFAKLPTVEDMLQIRAFVALTATLDHPNIVRLRETFEDKDFVYVVEDFCPGGSLRNWLQDGPFSETRAAMVMQQVFRAISYMHTQEVCHRDIQPANILFIGSAQDTTTSCSIKIAGLDNSCQIRKHKKIADMIGSPSYRAPEMSSNWYGVECDLWSCGVVLYEILHGRLPLSSGAEAEQMQVQTNKENQFWPQTANVSTPAQNLVGLLLDADPSTRCSARESLNHTWLKTALPKPFPMRLDASILARLKVFRRHLVPFQQAVFLIVASHLSDEETSSSRELFLLLDRDGDGKLTPSELESAIALHPKIASVYPNISDIFLHVGCNEYTRELAFTYTEFVAATFSRTRCLTEKVCRLAFCCFDKDGDGGISFSELDASLYQFDLSLEALETIFEEVDQNGDGKIDFEEFMFMVKKAY